MKLVSLKKPGPKTTVWLKKKFAEKLENIKNIKPARLLQLLPGERVMVTFDYLLKRGKDVLEEEEITLDEAIAL